jgi:serine/threonine-protein kinase RsbT
LTTVREGAIPLRSMQDIVASRQAVRKLAQELGFSLVDLTKMVTAASELARNTLVYGGGGDMRWEVLSVGGRQGLRVHFEDSGPGITDVEVAMTDGWSSGGGLGLGLSGSKRLVNDFEIRTAPGQGTCVTITRWK